MLHKPTLRSTTIDSAVQAILLSAFYTAGVSANVLTPNSESLLFSGILVMIALLIIKNFGINKIAEPVYNTTVMFVLLIIWNLIFSVIFGVVMYLSFADAFRDLTALTTIGWISVVAFITINTCQITNFILRPKFHWIGKSKRNL